jgi:hypothetical protein
LRADQVNSAVAQIVEGHKPVLPNLFLDTEVPLIDVGWPIVVCLNVDIGAVREEWGIVGGVADGIQLLEKGHWISAGLVGPWIFHIRARHADVVPEGRTERVLVGPEQVRPVSVHPEGGTNRHAVVAPWIPGQPEPGEELAPGFAVIAVPAFVLRVTGEIMPAGAFVYTVL